MGDSDVVEHEGTLWLVPKWLPADCGSQVSPERMVLLSQFRWQRFDPPLSDGMFVAHISVDDNLPRALIHGDPSSLARSYVVLDRPGVKFPRAPGAGRPAPR